MAEFALERKGKGKENGRRGAGVVWTAGKKKGEKKNGFGGMELIRGLCKCLGVGRS